MLGQVGRLCRDILNLQAEVNRVSNLLGNFPVQLGYEPMSDAAWNLPQEMRRTEEPRSEIQSAVWKLLSDQGHTAKELSSLLKAALRDLDGALRDIRVARLNIEEISGSGELRGVQRKWRPPPPGRGRR